VNAIAGIARADWQARTRSFAFVLVAAFALELAYLFAPDLRAGYVTVSVGEVRGIYNAPWMGAVTAICTVTIVAFVGFYLVRGAVARDELAGCAGIVAASPVRRFSFVAGKWASNCALLIFIAIVLLLGCAVMQQVRGEDRAFDAASYLLPFALLVVPSCALVAAFAALFDTIRPLRGVWGGALWFFVVTACVSVPLIGWTNGTTLQFADPFGFVPIIANISAAVHAAIPSVHPKDVTIGADAVSGEQRTFVWHGMTWSAAIVAARAAWLAVAIAIVGVASLTFDRFAGMRAHAQRRWSFPVGRVLPDIPGLRLVRAELTVLAGDSGFWWTAAAIGCGIAGAFTPHAALVGAVLPLALLLPLARYGTLGTRDRATGVGALISSAPRAATRTIVARIVAAGLIGCIPLAGALVRYPALAIVPFASAALAIVVGRFSGTPRAFEALYLAVWYAGALNHAPIADLPADASTAPGILLATSAIAIAASAAIARVQLRR
jgi:ABC-type transport system involved in multi-copper enzyme maturation permease subunit